MKKLSIVSLAVCLLFSCGKHNNGPGNGHNPPPVSKNLIKSIGSGPSANTYTYDDQGRLLRANFGAGGIAFTQYTYTDTTVTDTSFFQNGTRSVQTDLFRIASNGLATSNTFFVGVDQPSIVTSFTYNAGKQVVEQTVGEQGRPLVSRKVFFYSNGNLDSCKSYNLLTNQLDGWSHFEYYPNTQNTLGNANNGILYLGADNSNLLKKEVELEDGDTKTNEFTYEFDGQGRAIKAHQTQNGAPFADLIYTYY